MVPLDCSMDTQQKMMTNRIEKATQFEILVFGGWVDMCGLRFPPGSPFDSPITSASVISATITTNNPTDNKSHLDFLHLGLPLRRAEVSHLPQVVVRGPVDLHHDVLVHHILVRHLGKVPPQLPWQSFQAVEVVLQVERTLRHL